MDATRVIRITRGRPDHEELAAVLTVLLARAAAAPTGRTATRTRRSPATWRRLDRALGHRGPRSWRSETRHLRPRSAARA